MVPLFEQFPNRRLQDCFTPRPGEGNRGVWCLPGQEPPPLPRGFHVVKWRWIAERTFGWLNRFRRLSKDYEQLPASSAAFIYLAMTCLMLRRLVGG